MDNVLLHRQWVPEKQSYNMPRLKGIVVYRVGGATVETRYQVYEECVNFVTTCLGEQRRFSTVGEIGMNIPKNSEVSQEWAEKFIDENVVRICIAAIDG